MAPQVDSGLIELLAFPNGLRLFDDIQECQYLDKTDKTDKKVKHEFKIKRNKKVEHEFKAIGRLVQYDTEISGYVEKHKMKVVRGVKIKELLEQHEMEKVSEGEWIIISEISIEENSKSRIARTRKSFPKVRQICFKTSDGTKISSPVGAFQTKKENIAEIKKRVGNN